MRERRVFSPGAVQNSQVRGRGNVCVARASTYKLQPEYRSPDACPLICGENSLGAATGRCSRSAVRALARPKVKVERRGS